MVSWPTPTEYRRLLEAASLAEKVSVWLVQNSGEEYSGAVSDGYNFEGEWDDEWLVEGYNTRTYPNSAIGRHGNFLQWGFGEAPSKMTEDGRRLLVNCICYIKKFAGRPPLVRRQAQNRRLAVSNRAFTDELKKQYKGREQELYQLYKDNAELLRPGARGLLADGSASWVCRNFQIDFELKGLGITSNRRVSTLEQLVALLPDGSASPTEQAKTAMTMLKRYTTESFRTKAEWQQWLAANHDRLFFSDFGGYKFYVVPENYLKEPRPAANESFWLPK